MAGGGGVGQAEVRIILPPLESDSLFASRKS